MIEMFKHLLPTGRAWSLTANKPLRKFFEALDPLTEGPKDQADAVYGEWLPSTTTSLSEWESQFGLYSGRLTEAGRRSRLDAAWKNNGGQSPAYIQEQLQLNGFNVFVHEWWEPGTEASVGVNEQTPARNPLTVLNAQYAVTVPGVDCGEPLAQCGEEFAEAGNTLGGLVGYPLVNKFIYDSDEVGYTVPSDSQYWPFFMYVGGPNFGDIAEVPATRRYEFEALLLKIRPAHLWIGVIVRYV
ncbi:hypothetical protein Scuro_48 [Acinetobacter phage Scuro]|nr:hypothetical protein Scuro_48 [Acinetobacter phage Scuro]